MKTLLATVLLLCASTAWSQAYMRTPVPSSGDTGQLCVTWNRRSFTYVVDAAGSAKTPGDQEFIAIDSAFATWQTVSDSCSDFVFTRGARQANVKVGKTTEATNVVVFRETSCRDVAGTDACQSDGSCMNKYHCWDHSDFTIGLTTTTYSTRTGLIYDADIELNASPHVDGTFFLFTTISSPPCVPGKETTACTATDVQNTVTHEIGHAVGFDHVNVDKSTMQPTAPIGEIQKRIVDDGTAEGFCSVYPKGQPPLPCDESAQTRKAIIARNTGTPGLSAIGCISAPVGAWVGLALVLLRRRRSRG